MKWYFALVIAIIITACRSHAGFIGKENRNLFVTDQQIAESWDILSNEKLENDVAYRSMTSIVYGRPDSIVSYYIAFDVLPSRILASSYNFDQNPKHTEKMWLCGLSAMVNQEQGERKIACKILLAQSYLIVSELEERRASVEVLSDEKKLEYVKRIEEYRCRAKNIYNEIIYNKSCKIFHPLCTILTIRSLIEDSPSNEAFINKKLLYLKRYSNDYRFLVELYRFDEELKNTHDSFYKMEDVFEKQFEFLIKCPIANTPVWKSPIPITKCFQIAYSQKNLDMMLRLLPLLDDTNDTPHWGRIYRARLCVEIARLYMNSGDIENAKKYVTFAENLATTDEDARVQIKSLMGETKQAGK